MGDYQRIEEVLRHCGLSARALALALNLKSPQVFYDIKSGKCGISKELATKIQEHFLNISAAWLLTGEGEMLKNETPAPPTENNIAALCKILERAFVAIEKRDTQIDRLISVIENSRTKQ